MRDVHQDVASVDDVHVNRIGVQPRCRPGIYHAEPESAELQAGLASDHDGMAYVKLMFAAEAGLETALRNFATAMQIFNVAAVEGSVFELGPASV